MRRRILIAILSVTVVAVVLFGVPLAILIERFVDKEATLRVERVAVLASRSVPDDFPTGDPVELPDSRDGTVVALYDRDGMLVVGQGPAVADVPTLQALKGDVTDTEMAGTRIVAVPVSANEQLLGVIRAEQSTAASDARSRRIIALLAVLAAGVIAVGAAIGYFVAGRLARPVRRLRDAAVRLGDGDFTVAVPPSRVPELHQAADAITVTAGRLDDLVTRERSFSADASHQLRTPIAGMRAAIETELEFPRPDRTDVLHETLRDIDRLERIITELLSIARTPRAVHGSVSLAALLTDVEATWRGRLAASGRRLTVVQASDSLAVRGNRAMLRHALDVLLDNALSHGGGEVRVDLHCTAHAVTLSISDEGAGFAGEPAAPNKRVHDDGPHGLGLPLARRLVEAMPGRLAIARAGAHPRVDIVLQRIAAGDTYVARDDQTESAPTDVGRNQTGERAQPGELPDNPRVVR
jgi:signal transduction histidine kinase